MLISKNRKTDLFGRKLLKNLKLLKNFVYRLNT